MNMTTQTQPHLYTPKTLNDFVFADKQSEDIVRNAVKDIGSALVGKHGFLLHGPHGTGKTALALLLPTFIESTFGNPAVNANFNTLEIYCESLDGSKQLSPIDSFLQTTPFGSSYKYVILDEMDNFHSTVQASLKAKMNQRGPVIWIATTNHLNQIDKAIQNRLVPVVMNHPSPAQWAPKMRAILQRQNKTVPLQDLQALAEAAPSCSARDILNLLAQI